MFRRKRIWIISIRYYYYGPVLKLTTQQFEWWCGGEVGGFSACISGKIYQWGQKVNQIIFCPGADADAELGFRRYIITFTTALWANMHSF